MAIEKVMQELETVGTEQNRNVYKKHGVSDAMFGVSFGNLRPLAKKYAKDHELARALWETGNHDARILATMIADPQKADHDLVDRWADDINNYVLCDELARYISNTGLARPKMELWIQSDDEWLGRLGWKLAALLAMSGAGVQDTTFAKYLYILEKEIHQQPNRKREAMNEALIAIGIRNESLRTLALEVAARVGAVEVDHGDTNCKTPKALPYINKTWERRAKKSQPV